MKRPDQKSRGERRIDGRAKVRKVGRILVEEPRKIIPCILLDLSSTGALILVHDAVPNQFKLFYAATRTIYDVVVVRRMQDSIGVRFEGEAKVLPVGDKLLTELRAG